MTREVLGYSLCFLPAAGSVEAIARSRLLSERVHRTRREMQKDSECPVAREYLHQTDSVSMGAIFRVNLNKLEEARTFLDQAMRSRHASRTR